MNKRTRFVILLAVLALCFVFLLPSIKWYGFTPANVKDNAVKSLENIRDTAQKNAREDVAEIIKTEDFAASVDKLIDAYSKNKNVSVEEVDADLSWVKEVAAKRYSNSGKSVPSDMNVKAILSVSPKTDGKDLLVKDMNDYRAVLVSEKEAGYRKLYLDAKKNNQNSVKLGLDLAGGTNIIIKADLDAAESEFNVGDNKIDSSTFRKNAMEQVLDNLKNGIDRFGLSEPVVRQMGDDRIYMEVPGEEAANDVRAVILGKGMLNFRLVNNEATTKFMNYYDTHGFDSGTFDADGNLVEAAKALIPEGHELLGHYVKDAYGIDVREERIKDGKYIGRPYFVVESKPALEGNYITGAKIGAADMTGQPTVDFTLDSDGGKIFKAFTGAHINEPMALVSDGRIKFVANINSEIENNVRVTGFSYDDCLVMQKVLQSAWLNVPLEIESQEKISASLADDAKKLGLQAIIFGLFAVMVFMLVYYKGAGFNAVVAQVLNLYIMFSVLSAFNLTLSLPGIAGIILSIGMAVDANVVIFERIKEELYLGKSRAAAIAAGFDNAFWAIMDSNITTFIAAIFLSQLGTGAIQGFAISLAVGVVSSVFTALFVSRLMFDFNTEVIHHKNVSISWRVK